MFKKNFISNIDMLGTFTNFNNSHRISYTKSRVITKYVFVQRKYRIHNCNPFNTYIKSHAINAFKLCNLYTGQYTIDVNHQFVIWGTKDWNTVL